MLTKAITSVLRRTPVRQWRHYAIRIIDEQAVLQTRGDLAAWCDANDLPTLAQEARGRVVPVGALLVLIVGGSDGDAPHFLVLFDPRRGSSAKGGAE